MAAKIRLLIEKNKKSAKIFGIMLIIHYLCGAWIKWIVSV